MTNNDHKIFNIILILLPIVDLITGLSTRYLNIGVSLGSITKGIMILYFAAYILFLTNSKYKKVSIICIISSFIYVVLYFLLKSSLLSTGYIISEVFQLIKMLFFPIMFFALLCFYEDSGFDKSKMEKILLTILWLYLLFLVLPIATGTAENTYLDGSLGYIGWFYSGNEISAILVMLFPFLYTIIKRNKFLFILLLIIATLIIATIGTKASMIGLMIVGIILASITLITHKKNGIATTVCSVFALVAIMIIMLNGASSKNLTRIVEGPSEEEIIDMIEIKEDIIEKTKDSPFLSVAIRLFSSRDIYLISTAQLYVDNYSASTLMFGLGFSNTEKLDVVRVQKLIEIDPLDAFFHTGIFGLVILLSPYITSLVIFIYSMKKKLARFSSTILFYGLMILMSGGISCMSGHVLLAPSVSIFICIYMVFFVNELNGFKKNTLNENKVDILSLHLGFGGAERATIDLANILSEKYEVEIISLYKTVEVPPYKIDDRVKITYLTNTKPNREEFLTALKKFKILTVLTEGIKSTYILFLKNNLIKNHVAYSDAKYVISSRLYFTKILNTHGRMDAKKIAIEHNYDICEDYVKSTESACTNISRLVMVSSEAARIYKEKIPSVNTINIPNMVSDEYNTLSKLSTNNLIYVGRLEPEKGTMDLIELMNELHKNNTKVKMNIFGDGSLRKDMEYLIEKYNLKDNIKIHGFQDAKVIGDYYKDSSLFVLTSHKESFGIVLIESFACGVPAIAFKEATGARDIIKNNQNGYLIDERDIEDMANVIQDYLKKNIKNKKEMQRASLATAKKYSYSNVKSRWFKLLDELKDTE